MNLRRFTSSYVSLLGSHYRVLILSTYLFWYLYVVFQYFRSSYQIWSNALVIAAIVGIALNLCTEKAWSNRGTSIRLFIVPFAVSSYTSLIKDQDFFFIFPNNLQEVIQGLLFSFLLTGAYSMILLITKSNS